MAKRKRSNPGILGLSFSWKRALGVTSAKRKIARYTGIPITKNGIRAKAGRLMGCATYNMLIGLLLAVALTPLAGSAFAATTEEITFRGIPWFVSPVDFVAALDDSIFGDQRSSDTHFITDASVIYYDVIDEFGHIGDTDGYTVLYMDLNDELSVAGYTVNYIEASALYGVDETGAAIDDPAFAMTINATYCLSDSFSADSLADTESGCRPLELRLTDKYGEPNDRYTTNNGHCIVWFGKNGTYVKLEHWDKGDIHLEYGTMAIWGEIENAMHGVPLERQFADDGL